MNGICLVGCGAIAGVHATNLSRRARLFFHSRSDDKARRYAARHGGEAIAGRYEAVLARPEVDAVVLCSPPEHHADQVVAALAAGKAVLVEKPMCISREEVARIEAALQGATRPLLMVAENYRYKPLTRAIRGLLAAGRIGALQRALVRKVRRMETSGWKSAHGALLEGGIHYVALLSEIVGRPALRVASRAQGPRGDGGAERGTRTTIWYEGGAVAELEYAWNVPSVTRGVFQHSRLVGDRGRLTFESNGLYLLDGAGLRVPGLRDLPGYRGMMDDFLACLADRDRTPYSDFDKAKRDLEVVFLAYDDLAGGADGAADAGG